MSAVLSPSPGNEKTKSVETDDIKVMIVDDSIVVRGLVSSWVDEDPALRSVGKCQNGAVAVEKIAELQPDVVVLDIEMPVMDGLEALPRLIKNSPDSVIIMASTLTQRNAEISLKALSLGAADYVAKPTSNSGVSTSSAFRKDLIQKIRTLGRTKNRKRSLTPRSRTGASAKTGVASVAAQTKTEDYQLRSFSLMPPKILAIGSSTGGPPAMMKVLEQLGPSLTNIPVVVTQHMPATFTEIFAGHLARASGRRSAEGQDGEQLVPGNIYVAPGGRHMIVERNGAIPVIRLTDGADINYCKPAVDPLFDSVAKIYGKSCLAVVLTGMGIDGSKGALKIADAGGSVIAQDEATSVVWGMPGSTAKLGACSAILPLDNIANKLKQIIKGG